MQTAALSNGHGNYLRTTFNYLDVKEFIHFHTKCSLQELFFFFFTLKKHITHRVRHEACQVLLLQLLQILCLHPCCPASTYNGLLMGAHPAYNLNCPLTVSAFYTFS